MLLLLREWVAALSSEIYFRVTRTCVTDEICERVENFFLSRVVDDYFSLAASSQDFFPCVRVSWMIHLPNFSRKSMFPINIIIIFICQIYFSVPSDYCFSFAYLKRKTECLNAWNMLADMTDVAAAHCSMIKMKRFLVNNSSSYFYFKSAQCSKRLHKTCTDFSMFSSSIIIIHVIIFI